MCGVIIHFADELATVPEKDNLPPHRRTSTRRPSCKEKALAMEIGRELRDEVTYKKARAYHQAKNTASFPESNSTSPIRPDWSPVAPEPITAGLKKDNPPPAGKYPLQARFYLAKAQNEQRVLVHARSMPRTCSNSSKRKAYRKRGATGGRHALAHCPEQYAGGTGQHPERGLKATRDSPVPGMIRGRLRGLVPPKLTATTTAPTMPSPPTSISSN